ncbi:type I DNA topoisomerase [Xylanimonas allomyrinae]|uniref:DNA topoisomerase 1 n=1 Tax=Xylanimonas allomyrinae TaxID=2509459 RepID=A0A4P6ERV8_9MICO|nr:type I DNA topoisomerase [Xylanimonas allomyrinae]QAY64249.1 type I DNA topoisomerase [Xylanimonas allomyrinae]
MPRKLVIVESPTKARKIAGYLGKDYEVEASVGHIRDLPQPSELPAEMKKGPFGKFAVDVTNGFEPYYEVYADKKAKVRELKKALKEADELFLATDEDREGEAIAWHLIQELKPKVPVRRMVFHEITREAILRALESTRELDTDLVDAQETRRILDRLYGYEVSPVLWRKVRQGLSAGRVQSVATRLVVERERERMAFVAASYWDVTGSFAPTSGEDAGTLFTARLTGVAGERVASGRDFDDKGRLKVRTGVVHLDEATANAVVAGLDGAGFSVRSLETKPYTRKPAAPFTTSTLQQEASRKLRMNARATMRTAQSLYENGYITYMRTDSPALSSEAIDAARRQAAELYGTEYVPGAPRLYQSKSAGAQEAHEAIRPAGDSFRTPAQVAGELTGDQFRLYELIWKRTVASQMADAKGSTASVRLAAALSGAAGDLAGRDAVFSASGTVITFRGFLAAYEEGSDTEDAPEAATTGKDARLPRMAEGDALDARDLSADGHSTTPPARFTEASLVKALEELGIGRPSTYAATISTIQDRGYVRTAGQALIPTWLAFAVTRLLEDHFGSLVDYRFTAAMEADLDEIAAGERERVAWLTEFYFGGSADAPAAGSGTAGGLKNLVENLGEIDPVAINSVEIGDGLRVRVGRYGPYLEDLSAPVAEGENPPRASVPDDLAPDELTVEKARELLAAGGDDGRSLGADPATGHEIIAKAGRYGPYVTEVLPEPVLAEGLSAAARKKALAAQPKPRTASLFKDMDLATVTLDDALKLLSLPRVVGVDPESGTEITAQNGRYGPYLKKGTDSRTLASEAMLLTVTLDEALKIYAEPKRGRGARGAAQPPLRELGDDPTSGKPIVVKDGRFGPYVTDGETNRTLPRDVTPESITPERAIELLAEKRAAGPAKRRTTARKPAAPRKKAAAK